MIALTRIYTRTGDKGSTALGSGKRVSKAHLRIEAFGTVDETNAAVGLARLHTVLQEFAALDAMLARIQNELFDVGADLCLPETGNGMAARPCGCFRSRSPASNPRSMLSTPNSSPCAPSFSPAAMPPPPIFICAEPFAGGPNG